ncbi:hypothetical protein [Sorangium atrum]|uniref:Uncharacterized protein n=1 Tax=Sorangium atrum TaxID=2995308 RepID=A0ABT5C0R0_9BACT|nr:hypothetical protein [Sorangium aterium]MDC0679563.1 hypothetical protein [Sorangium aterium]
MDLGLHAAQRPEILAGSAARDAPLGAQEGRGVVARAEGLLGREAITASRLGEELAPLVVLRQDKGVALPGREQPGGGRARDLRA